MIKNFVNTFTIVITLFICGVGACSGNKTETSTSSNKETTETSISDSTLLDIVQKAHLDYMWTGADTVSGLAYERIHEDNNYGGNHPSIITTGGSGFGIAGLVVAMHRHFISRTEGVARLKKIVGFLHKADRFHGVWPHWLYPSGRVAPFSQKDDGGDLVESSFLMQGLLIARQYLDSTNSEEKNVMDSINLLWHEMEFDWYRRDNQNVLYWHWSPNYGWEMNFPLQGYNECILPYILAASSPTHSISYECYKEGWMRNGNIKSSANPYGYPLRVKHNGAEKTGGPLFWAHYSWIGLCPKNMVDDLGINWWEVVQNHALSNYAYCVENPKKYSNYSVSCWGLTASYSPTGYVAHAPNNDMGVITPTAALSSFPYTPEQSMNALRYFYSRKATLWGEYGFYDAFSDNERWYPRWYLAIDQLTIAPMIENYRSGLLWQLFMSCTEIQQGLTKLHISH